MGQRRAQDIDASARGRGRRWGIAFGVAATVLLMAAPAWAAPGTSRSASAYWNLGDPQQTRVSLQATAADAEEPGSLFLHITQSYCDTATDQRVFRGFTTLQPLDPGDFRVHPHLKSARLMTSTTVTGTEQRLAGCSSPSGVPTFVSLDPSTIDVDATWTATGPSYEVQPGVTGRNAVATGSITGSTLSLGSLGPSQLAQLRSQTTP